MRKAEAELTNLRAEFEVPEVVGDLCSDILYGSGPCLKVMIFISKWDITKKSE